MSNRHLSGAVIVLLLISRVSSGLELSASTNSATAGYFTLAWFSPDIQVTVLQQSTSPEFHEYTETHVSNVQQSTLTGFNDGKWYFRLKGSQGEYSNIVNVEVHHHSLSKAFLFFTLGLLMFCLLITILILGYKQHRSSLLQ